MFKCIAFGGAKVVAAGRAVADGVDCSYLCDIVVHSDYQGRVLGKRLVQELIGLSAATGRSCCMRCRAGSRFTKRSASGA